MKTKSPSETGGRAYRSELREKHARATRAQIVEAAVAMMVGGERDIAYAALARAARVSTPTVYRNFPTRDSLFEAIFEHLATRDAQRGVVASGIMGDDIAGFFARFDDADGMYAKVTRLNTLFEFSRATTVPRRRAAMEAWVATEVPGLGDSHRTWVVDLGVLLVSSAMAEAARGYLDLSGAQTAARVTFALDALLNHARTLVSTELS